MDFEGGVDVLDANRGASGALIGFAVSRESGLTTLCGDDGVASSEVDEEVDGADCGAGIWFGTTVGLDGTDWGTRGEFEIGDFGSG
jgi:hypothetical protein